MDESLGRSSYYLLGRLLLSCRLWECRNTEQPVPVSGVRCLPLNSRLIFAAAAASQQNVAAAESIHEEIFRLHPCLDDRVQPERILNKSDGNLTLLYRLYHEISAFKSEYPPQKKRPTLLQQLYVCDWNTAHNVPLQVRDRWESVTASL